MGRRCFVPNCTSGYDSNKEKISVFSVPKDEELLKKWRKVIPRNDRVLGPKAKVCEKHFVASDIVKQWSCAVNTIPLNRYYLKKDAVPCIFPKYLTRIPKKRRIINKHELSVAKKTKTSAVTIQPETSILNLSETKKHLKVTPSGLQYQEMIELTCNNESTNEISRPIEEVLIKEEITDNYVLQDGNFLQGEEAMDENDEFSTLEKLENINENLQYSSSLNEEHHILENFLNRVKKETELNIIPEEIHIKDECLVVATDSNSENISNNELINEGTSKPDCNPTYSEGGKNRGMDQNVNRVRTKRYKCDKCPLAFPYPSYVKRHSRIHAREGTLKCKICEKTFKTVGSLNIHNRMHTGEKLNECDLCNKKFTRKSQLIVHKRIHNNERPFKCSICQKEFKENGHLTKHMPIHTREKPFKCQFCKYKCAQTSDLKRHMGIHTGEKPFKCELCQYKCTQAVNLKRHMRIHTGEKPFSCKHCKKAFNDLSTLRRHIRTLHTN